MYIPVLDLPDVGATLDMLDDLCCLMTKVELAIELGPQVCGANADALSSEMHNNVMAASRETLPMNLDGATMFIPLFGVNNC
jgi:hypothetical protein